jgi:quercetin dioxygenase-like cupin family protein
MTYVRGDMTDWRDFIHDRDFAQFFTKTMNEIKPIFAPHNPLDKELEVINAWGNCLAKGNVVDVHMHHNWHGILYLTEGAPLHFPDMNMTFTPKPGHWLISPPHIRHGTEEIQEDKERVCVVFNFDIQDKFRQVNEKHNNTEEWKKVKNQL